MKHFGNEEYINALEEIKEIRETFDPLVALLLIDSYRQIDLESLVRKLPVNVIEHIDIRFHLIFQLLQNQKRNIGSNEFPINQYSEIEAYNKRFCDFKEVMIILDRARGTVETLIKEHKINPIPDKPKAKRSFLREEIIRYRDRSR